MPPNLSSLPDDLSFLSSEPFEVISQSGKHYFVHSKILATQPEPSNCTTTGVLGGAAEKKIDLSDWDDDTVERFVHFLYSGNYRFPKSALGAAETEATADINVLLVHAKVYVLAQYKDIAALRTMALERLKMVLGEIDSHMFPRMAMNVIELLVYVYSNTGSLANSEEPIRALVSTFAAENVEKLMVGEMSPLVGEGGDFAIDLVGGMTRRLCDAAKKTRNAEQNGLELETLCSASESRVEVRKLERSTEDKVKELMTNKVRLEREVKQLKDKVKWLEAASLLLAQRWINK